MAELIKVNKKVINDPLYSPVIRFLKNRIAKLEVTGPESELALSKERYDGLVAGDLVIENAIHFPDGAVRVCIVSRKTGFARVDIDITQVEMKDIIEDFSVPLIVINDVSQLKSYVKANETAVALLWLSYKNTYGVLLNQDKARTHAGPMEAFGDLFFEQYTTVRDSETSIDWETLESGTVTIEDPSFGQGTYPLFIYELALAEAQIPEITSNLPEEITTRRGETFEIPNTYLFGETEDITLTADIVMTTNSGYVIPTRSSDLLTLDGETIFGSATKEVTDEIVVRVSYPYNGRTARKTFRIKVIIEKDIESDLTIRSTPTDVTATNGDTVEIKLSAYYKNELVEILIPPSTLVSQKQSGTLTFIRTNSNKEMIYRGTVNGTFPPNQDQTTDLWSGVFNYNLDGSTYSSTGYVNLILVREGVKPEFDVTGVPSLITGYKEATGSYLPVITYGEETLSLSDIIVDTGPQGSKQLIEITSVTDQGVYWKLINNSEIPGMNVIDNFIQTFSWLDEFGVLQSKEFLIQVDVKLDSITEIVPIEPGPITVDRYQYGGPTFKLMVNGEDKTDSISGFSVKPSPNPDDQYIVNAIGHPNKWQVIRAKNIDYNYTASFTFTAIIDGKTKVFNYDQEFLIKAWTGSTDPDDPEVNTSIVIAPETITITGESDEEGTLSFKVFQDVNDVTDQAKIVTDKTVQPDKIRFTDISYNALTKMFVVTYYKDGKTTAKGAIYAALKSVENPTPSDMGKVTIETNVEQKTVLKVISAPSNIDITVEEAFLIPLTIEYSGVVIGANDPNLSITQIGASDIAITEITAPGITVENDTWKIVDGSITESIKFRLSYRDPEVPDPIIVDISISARTIYPSVRIDYIQTEITGKIWDKGVFPFKLKAGNHDFTSSITSIGMITGNTYVKNTGINWEIYNAELDSTTTVVGLNIGYTIGESTDKSIGADFKFNIAAWDGITFSGNWDPTVITGKSGDTGEIVFNFIYKGEENTQGVSYLESLSDVPETVLLDLPTFVSGKGLVFTYTLTRGGSYPLTLGFKSPGVETLTATLQTEVQWPDGLNIVTVGKNISGNWNSEVELPLIINIDGEPLALTSPNLNITAISDVDGAIVIDSINDETITFKLVTAGDLGTKYNYTVGITIVYTNPVDQSQLTKDIEVPGSIYVPEIIVGNNPIIVADVYEQGSIDLTLVTDIGENIEILSCIPDGMATNVTFLNPRNWYISNGSTTARVPGILPLTLGFNYAGEDRTILAQMDFDINIWDGVQFKVDTDVSEIEGPAGQTGEMNFNYSFLGFPLTGVKIDPVRSHIPNNILLGDLSDDGVLPYTLATQLESTLKLVIERVEGNKPGVINVDYAVIEIPVITTSSNEPFLLIENDEGLPLEWSKTGALNFKVSYGGAVIPANTPGLTYNLKDQEIHGVEIDKITSTGITLKATRSDVAGSITVYPENLIISYEVGAPEPKTVNFDFEATVSMGQPALLNNGVVTTAIWRTGVLRQTVTFNGTPLNTVERYELQGPKTYIEITDNNQYEVIKAEPTETTQPVPMTLYYKVDASEDLQQFDFNGSFKIAGHVGAKFKVEVVPEAIEGSLDTDVILTCTPYYKDVKVGSGAIFKPELSTIPKELTLKETKTVGDDYVITFTGKEAGRSELVLVFWSPEATGPVPDSEEVWKGTFPVTIMGELTLEIGARDNLLTAASGDEGTYSLQVLFGGIPIDIAKEISDGNMSANVVIGELSSANANVLDIPEWNSEGFNYHLEGPVAPNSAVNVSDFIDLSYRFGGNNYTRQVEIPMRYTSPAPVITVVIPNPVNVFQEGNVNPVITCAGVNISSGYASVNNTDEDKYIQYSGKTFKVIWGETTPLTHSVSSRFIGRYRNWEWAATSEITFNISAWNQKTWDPITAPVSWDTYPGQTTTVSVTAKYMDEYPATVAGCPVFDPELSDLKGLVEVTLLRTIMVNGVPTAQYQFKSLITGEGDIKLAWRRPAGTSPGVEGIDYGFTDFSVKTNSDSLIITGPTNVVSGGNGDVITNAPLIVKRQSTGSQISNLATGMVIKPVNEDIFKISKLTASAMDITITAPYTDPDGPVTVPMTFTYTDPVTSIIVNGTFDYPITLKRPADWPVATQLVSSPIKALWEYGPIPFKIMSGTTDVSSSAVPVSCQDPDVGLDGRSGYMEMSYNQPIDGTWYWMTSAAKASNRQTRVTKWVMTVPYRGSTIDIEGTFTYIMEGAGDVNQDPFKVTPNIPKVFLGNIGEETEIAFTVTWRNYKYGDAVFKPEVSGSDSVSFNDVFEVIGQRYDSATGTTYLNVSPKTDFSGDMSFVFDLKDTVVPEPGVNRATAIVNIYGMVITLLPDNNWVVWDTKLLTNMISIKDGDTDITGSCTILSSSDNKFVITQSKTGVQLQSNDPFPAQSINVTYRVQLPSSYGNRVITVVVPSNLAMYDGKEFVWEQQGVPGIYNTAIGNNAAIFGYYKFRGIPIETASELSITTAELKAVNGDWVRFISNTRLQSGIWQYVFTGDKQYTGTFKMALHYSGPNSGTWVRGTLGKNYLEQEFQVIFYENKLYIYPSPSTPAAVSGLYPDVVNAPMKLSVGANILDNVLATNIGNLSWTILSTTQTGVVSKPTTNHTTASGVNLKIDYDNRGSTDITVDLVLRFTYTGVYRGTNVPTANNANIVDIPQRVVIKGSNTGDVIVTTPTDQSGSVWSTGGAPFTIVANGKTIPSSAIKSITIDSNPYVRRPEITPNFSTRWWEIYNGEPVNTVTNVNFTVVFNDGVKDFTVSQIVKFTITAYNGIDLTTDYVTSLLSTFNQGITAAIGENSTINITGRYKGAQLSASSFPNFSIWDSKSTIPGFLTAKVSETTGGSGNYYVGTYKAGNVDAEVSTDGTIYFGLKSKENDPTAIEGKDYVKMVIPSYVYLTTRFYIVSHDTTLSGRYGNGTSTGTTIRLNYRIRRGLTIIQNNTGGNTTVGAAITDPNILGVGYYSNVGDEPVWFLNELTSAPQKTTRVKFTVNPLGGVINQSSFFVDVTQLSNLSFPTVSNVHQVETSLNGSGTLPFILRDDANVDITSQATITAVSQNDYIELRDGKWYCYNTRTGDTTVTVTLTFTISYKGNNLTMTQDVVYLVKPFTSQPTVSNVKIVTANVWDKGTALPFTINVNNSPIPNSWITDITGVATNGRVTASLSVPWKIISGSLEAGVSDTVAYTVTVNSGSTIWTVKQDVVFNINKYDGKEFKLSLVNLTANGDLLVQAATNYRVTSQIQGTLRGELITGSPGFTLRSLVDPINISNVLAGNLTGVTKVFNSNAKAIEMVKALNVATFNLGSASTGDVEGINYATLIIPVTTYVNDKMSVNQSPSSITGKFGDVFDITADLRYSGGTKVPMNSPSLTISMVGASAIEVVPGSLTETGYKVRFKADVTTATTTTTTIDYTYIISGSTGRFIRAPLIVNQVLPQSSVTATGTMGNINYGETGQIVLTGTVGPNPLAGNVTFAPANSDAKGLVTFGVPTTGNNGTVVIPVTGIKVGKDNLTIRITVNGATGNVSGKDYLDVIVPAEVNYGTMEKSEDFETSGTGYQNAPVTLTQSVIIPTDE